MKGLKGKMTDLENSLKNNPNVWKRAGIEGEATVPIEGQRILLHYCLRTIHK